MAGFAVIDLETTGFAYNHTDRICEIAVVLLDANGRRENTYTTLVNPQRDLGAQHIHGIDATDARVAPTFDRIVGDLTELVAGRVVVAHNSVFDTAFLAAEYARAGWPLALRHDMTVCTMRLASLYGAPRKLGECCAHFGIPLTNAHSAAADAEATSLLLSRYIDLAADKRPWHQWLEYGEAFPWPTPPALHTRPVARGETAPGSGLLLAAATLFETPADVPGSEEYLDLLDRVLLDGKISTPERRALDELARTLGLGVDAVAQLHRAYAKSAVDAACEDDRFTVDERAAVIRLARLLELSDLEIEALLAKAAAQVSEVGGGLVLEAGDLVVLTGMSEARKAELAAAAQARGLVVWPGVKKSVKAVIAQDPGSSSGKARKAREYGIPVVGEDVLG